ncbi:tetratricopeptide repeat protein [Tautonia plasticadhaerens]|uniref:Photosystem I assembly protein Ycf3 n=1 Tax=Tautonia plasticadhaerens TaxID=2527974 RepID=A0A518H2K4_9BACT|nr:tetratricopeptide repeat protein [Tautonia plasticadhaerens]QDV35081.1 photosystem I assembly protein Ycf3 [Tautonia plasticadhaerens]
MSTLIVRDVSEGDGHRFQVIRDRDFKATNSASIPSPIGFPVEGRPNSELMRDLRWYLERFLDYPFPPQTDVADRVRAALKGWGETAFTALFGAGQGNTFFHDATRDGLDRLHLRISSDDPRVLGWPWEALLDPQSGFLAPACQIERQLNTTRDPAPLPDALPNDRINILLVTCRPFEADVSYRSLSRPLVEMVVNQNLPAEVTVLRPPTFDRLREHLLHERPGYYQVVHFDGHGAYQAEAVGPIDQHQLKGPIGKLAFEDVEGKPDLKDAEQLALLLRECRITAVVMNACQSGMVDHQAADPFASVAAAMLRAGVRSVVAMAYSLYVSGAQQFLPGFYRALFRTGDIAQATRAGRQQMLAYKGRVCVRGRFDLDDWLVPVVYQQEALALPFASQARTHRPPTDADALPPEARDDENPYGFVGRDGPILVLERAMHLPRAGILIQGLGGVGKTTLARGFVRWLKDTGGLGRGCFWFTFQGIRTAEYVINRMVEALIGTDAIPLPLETKLDRLIALLKADRVLVVWDNFETVRGIPGTPVEASLPAEDQELLRSLLRRLRDGKSKVLITSRSTEDWLGDSRLKIGLGGLAGEERWDYCETILRDLGKSINRDDPDLGALMDLLAGHPLAMRVLLPRLEDQTAAQLVLTIRDNLSALGPSGDEIQDTLFATLRFAVDSLPDDLRPLLILLALHEHFVDADSLEAMAKDVDKSWTRDRIDQFVSILSNAGLLRNRGLAIYEIHPALTGFLRSTSSTSAAAARDPWCRAFSKVIGSIGVRVIGCPVHEQRGPFSVHSTNFNRAWEEASRLEMDRIATGLVATLASYAQNTWNFQHAERLLQRLTESRLVRENERLRAGYYHQLGVVAQLRWDLDAAERWYAKALEIKERLGVEAGPAATYHQLGMVAQLRWDLDAAERWYARALESFERLSVGPGRACSYHQLGTVAQDREDLDAAERWYTKALEISERLGDEPRAAGTYHQLGRVAQDRGDLDDAERWYVRSLEIKERLGDEAGVSLAYHQLGIVAQLRWDLDAAECWYARSLEISERLGDEAGAARTYTNLGIVVQDRGDQGAAERWYTKALTVWTKTGNEQERENTQRLLDKLRDGSAS